MRRTILLLSLLSISLALGSCGGEPPSDTGLTGLTGLEDLDTSDPEYARKAAESLFSAVHETELTQELMQELYDLHRKMKAAEGNPVKAAILFRDTHWNMATYTKAMVKLEGLKSALKRGPEKAHEELSDAKQQIADLEERAANATGDEKVALEQALAGSKLMLAGLEQQAKSAEGLNDPAYRSFIEGWIARFEALEND